MKVKNVIKGLLKEYELTEITIIGRDIVIFSGTPDQWVFTDVDMTLYKKKIENAEVVKRMLFNYSKAFIFIDDGNDEGEQQ